MNDLIIVRGGDDIATGTIYKLHQCGFDVLVLEIDESSAIRRRAAFCEAVYSGSQTVEGITCRAAESVEEAEELLKNEGIALMVDPQGSVIKKLHPLAVVDAIIAKKNLGTNRDMADITIGLGPGFCAGDDVDAVIETKRGHDLGRVIYEGCAMENTGVPGSIAGHAADRVIHSPASGVFRSRRNIADIVEAGDIIAVVDTGDGEVPVRASMDGLLRGILHDGYRVDAGTKAADIDPRKEEHDNCFTISDKARCIAGGVLEAILHLKGQKNDICG